VTAFSEKESLHHFVMAVSGRVNPCGTESVFKCPLLHGLKFQFAFRHEQTRFFHTHLHDLDFSYNREKAKSKGLRFFDRNVQ
jgi:hypothetical protein